MALFIIPLPQDEVHMWWTMLLLNKIDVTVITAVQWQCLMGDMCSHPLALAPLLHVWHGRGYPSVVSHESRYRMRNAKS